MEEVELGGLEDEEDDTLAAGIEEEEFLFDKEVPIISFVLCSYSSIFSWMHMFSFGIHW